MFGFGERILEGWAAANGYQLLSRENCWFFKGPYFWSATRGQQVFRFTARDSAGLVRGGYAKCGGYWLGTLSDQIDVTWDD